jgi:hypothetical protein
VDFKNRDRHSGEIRLPVRIYRTDGSNRTYEADRTHGNESSITVRVSAVFAVGEVVELAFPAGDAGKGSNARERARVMYRNIDQYGLLLLSAQVAAPERISA